jgi:acyl-CoA synthetase (AMP-forming)/AMP-acid ligase II
MCHDELFVVGRLKDLIIIRGKNVYPQDVEETAGSAIAPKVVAGSAAFSINVGQEEKLVLLQEVQPLPRVAAETEYLRDSIRVAISRKYGVELYDLAFVPRRTLDRTTSGKIRRAACRERYLAGEWAG